jgi:hypothetical protein
LDSSKRVRTKKDEAKKEKEEEDLTRTEAEENRLMISEETPTGEFHDGR